MTEIWLSDEAVMKIAIFAALAQIIIGQGLLMLARRGWPAPVLGGAWSMMIAVGFAALAVGAAALIGGQPIEVVVLFFAVGVAYVGAFGVMSVRLRKNIRLSEFNKALSQDL